MGSQGQGKMVGFIGRYPKEFNPKVHGPFVTGRFYGKPDTAFSDVKLGELGKWLSRRDMGPGSGARALGRLYGRWMHRWMWVKKPTFAPLAQVSFAFAVGYYYMFYHAMIKYEAHYKYH